MRTRVAPPSSAALPAAICGRAASRIAPRPTASSATPISSAPTAKAAANSRRPTTSPTPAPRWRATPAPTFIVLTGGEPMLQVDAALIDALHARGFTIAIETNGTLPVPRAIDWICVSPKAGTDLQQRSGDELKLVYPQADLDPDDGGGASVQPSLPAADGRPRRQGQHRPGHRLLQGPPRLAPVGADPQAARHPVTAAAHWNCSEKSPRDPACASTKSSSSKPPTILPSAPAGSPNARVHGHSFRARVTIDGAPGRRHRLRVPFRRAGRRHGRRAGRARPSPAQRGRRPRGADARAHRHVAVEPAAEPRAGPRPRSRSRATAAARAPSTPGPRRRASPRSNGHGQEGHHRHHPRAGDEAAAEPRRGDARARAEPAPRRQLRRALHRAGVHLRCAR